MATETSRPTWMRVIMIAVDGSEASKKALSYSITNVFDAKTDYVIIIAKLQRSETTIASGAQRLLDEALAEVKSAHPGIQVEAMLGEGDPRDVLCDRAAEDFVDFIIVGSQGKTALTVRQPRLLSSYDAVRCVCVGGCAGVNVRPRGVQSRPNQPVSRPAAAAVVSAAAGATARGKDAMEVGGSGQAQVCAQYSLAEVVKEMATKNHPNLVRLVGYCLDFSPVTERMEQIVIYEFMPHGDLEHWIGPCNFSPLQIGLYSSLSSFIAVLHW
ncbi:unnamed protein product [Closterium sp. NIES-65]|nr:unnamed protein product [Closterium sp. NIES-65]